VCQVGVRENQFIREAEMKNCKYLTTWTRSRAIGLLLMIAVAVSMAAAQMQAQNSDYVTVMLNQISSRYRPYAVSLGQRLSRPGKERISATGTLTSFIGGEEQAAPVQVIWQFPLKIRVKQKGKDLVCDRNNAAQSIPGNKKDADTIQTLLEDSVEGFLAIARKSGMSRHLGSGYRLMNAAPTDPCMDIVLISYPDVFKKGQTVNKEFWFNSRTKLLGLVAYLSASGVDVHIVIDDWRDVGGEKLPFLIERWEDDKIIMRLTLESAAVSCASDDGIFGGK
jgi:hypothetical protein